MFNPSNFLGSLHSRCEGFAFISQGTKVWRTNIITFHTEGVRGNGNCIVLKINTMQFTPVRLTGLNDAPSKTFKNLPTLDREAFVKNLLGV